ncbi:hypothetical protein RFI_24213, partial [Reticulomyxa filosa]
LKNKKKKKKKCKFDICVCKKFEKEKAEKERIEQESKETKKSDDMKIQEMEKCRIDETNQLRTQLESAMNDLHSKEGQCQRTNTEVFFFFFFSNITELEERVESLGDYNRNLQSKVESLEGLEKEWTQQQHCLQSQVGLAFVTELTRQIEMYTLSEKKWNEKEEDWTAQVGSNNGHTTNNLPLFSNKLNLAYMCMCVC